MTKEELLKQVWETCSFDDIINTGFEYNKCSAKQLINAANEFESNETNEDNFIEKLAKLFEETPKSKLPWGREVMRVLTDYYYNNELIDYFDNDELIDCLEDSCEMDDYIIEKTKEISKEYEDNVYTFKDYTREVEELPNWKLKKYLCDLVMANYHISDNELMQKLIERIK